MASESNSPADLSAIPANVSGDGTTFVRGLKNYLKKYDRNVEAKISQIGEGSVHQVTSLRLSEEHRTNSSGNVNDIRVEFDTVNISDYSFAQIWVKTENENSWTKHGNTSGVQYLIENVETGKRYYVKVVACNSNAGYANFEEAPQEHIDIKGSVLLCNTPTQFYWDNTDNKWHWGGYVDNGYTDFFELRIDQNAGIWNDKRLDAIPADIYYSTVVPPTRMGTAYLYVRNIYGQYNSPATHQYSITAPTKPTKPELEATLDGIIISLQNLPSGCTHYIVDVDGEEFEVWTSQWAYYQFGGLVTVKYCFVDSIGRSEWSDSVESIVGREILETDISDNAISTPKLSANAITSAKIAANAITSDKINAGAVNAEKIAAGSIIIGGATDNNKVVINDNGISGSKIQAGTIIGDKIAGNTITGNHLKAGSVTAEKIAAGAIQVGGSGGNVNIQNGAIDAAKLNVSTLSAITALIGELKTADSGARLVIKDNLIEAYDANNVLRVKLGVW